MREIKFRAWDKVEKKMKLPTLLRLSRDLPYTDDNNNGKVFQMQCNGQENVEYFNGRIELMQYTGLKDKNGKEIYEGDICKVSNDSYYTNGYWNTEEDEWELVMKVVYTETSYSLEEIKDKYMKIFLDEAIWESMELEVIGNIYENPELLEEE